MKTLRLVSSPTRNRRLNEILGLTMLVGAGLLLLALASYTPSDPSFDTVGGLGASIAGIARPAHNWTGLVGAYFADAMLQILGVAAFFLPLLLVRLGVCWIRSKPAGSAMAKMVGLILWVVFAPAAVALLPGNLLWRSSLPIAGLSGRMVADVMVHLLNLPGASITVALMVALSLYLATTFTFDTAREWTNERFGFIGAARERGSQCAGRGRRGVWGAARQAGRGGATGARAGGAAGGEGCWRWRGYAAGRPVWLVEPSEAATRDDGV
jgi:S-DNA-T family DNA segregation ATPase FtsK/SpoIIIE